MIIGIIIFQVLQVYLEWLAWLVAENCGASVTGHPNPPLISSPHPQDIKNQITSLCSYTFDCLILPMAVGPSGMFTFVDHITESL